MNNCEGAIAFLWRTARCLAVILLLGVVAARGGPLKQTMWVFPSPSGPNPVTNGSARQTLIANAAATGIAQMYVSVYSPNPNSAGRLMYDETAIADLITIAHTNGMQVFAAYGAPDWPTFGCNANGFPLQRMAEVAGYNLAHPSAKFDGVVLDIEPPEPQSTSTFRRYSHNMPASVAPCLTTSVCRSRFVFSGMRSSSIQPGVTSRSLFTRT